MKKVLFLHGLESKPGGSKVKHLRELGYEVLNPALPDSSYEKSVIIAQRLIDEEKPVAVIGSSRGGAIAMKVNIHDAKLVLIAPAWKIYNEEVRSLPSDTVILHSENDDIVPIEDSEKLVENWGVSLLKVGECHRMHDEEALYEIGVTVNNMCG